MVEWIRCAEQMPKNGERVSVWDGGVIIAESTGSVCSYRYYGIFLARAEEGGDSVKCYATHWMPLPKSPLEK